MLAWTETLSADGQINTYERQSGVFYFNEDDRFLCLEVRCDCVTAINCAL